MANKKPVPLKIRKRRRGKQKKQRRVAAKRRPTSATTKTRGKSIKITRQVFARKNQKQQESMWFLHVITFLKGAYLMAEAQTTPPTNAQSPTDQRQDNELVQIAQYLADMSENQRVGLLELAQHREILAVLKAAHDKNAAAIAARTKQEEEAQKMWEEGHAERERLAEEKRERERVEKEATTAALNKLRGKIAETNAARQQLLETIKRLDPNTVTPSDTNGNGVATTATARPATAPVGTTATPASGKTAAT